MRTAADPAALARSVRDAVALLFGVTATDAATYATVSLVILLVAAFAALLPALSAAQVDPGRHAAGGVVEAR
ncbi:MAG: hypothetical protein ACRD8O_22300 [Bryobacteraceae bacterium]